MKAVIDYERKLDCSASVPKGPKLNQEQETKRNIILESISTAKSMCISGSGMVSAHKSELEVGAEFLEVITRSCLTLRTRPNFIFILYISWVSSCAFQFIKSREFELVMLCFCRKLQHCSMPLSLKQENRLKQIWAQQ